MGFFARLSFLSKNLQFGTFVFSLQLKRTFMYKYYKSRERDHPPLFSALANIKAFSCLYSQITTAFDWPCLFTP